MTDTLLAALVTYGALLMFLTAFLSCVAVPIPMSLVMITGGALAAQGDLVGFGAQQFWERYLGIKPVISWDSAVNLVSSGLQPRPTIDTSFGPRRRIICKNGRSLVFSSVAGCCRLWDHM